MYFVMLSTGEIVTINELLKTIAEYFKWSNMLAGNTIITAIKDCMFMPEKSYHKYYARKHYKNTENIGR